MAPQSRSQNPRRARRTTILNPSGKFHPRVEAVGPQCFGIVSIDCAKACSRCMLADFYGNIVLPPADLVHRSGDFNEALNLLAHTVTKRKFKDLIVAVERTGRYHRPVRNAFAKAGYEVRTVHPFATKQFRQPADPGTKTDDTDLAAIHRAAVNGFGLIEPTPDPTLEQLKLVARFRRTLIQKRTTLCSQIQEHLEAAMPGYAACFQDLWKSEVPLAIVRFTGSADAVRQADVDGLSQHLRDAGIRFRTPTLHKDMAWAQGAPPQDDQAAIHQRLWLLHWEDITSKNRQIQMSLTTL